MVVDQRRAAVADRIHQTDQRAVAHIIPQQRPVELPPEPLQDFQEIGSRHAGDRHPAGERAIEMRVIADGGGQDDFPAGIQALGDGIFCSQRGGRTDLDDGVPFNVDRAVGDLFVALTQGEGIAVGDQERIGHEITSSCDELLRCNRTADAVSLWRVLLQPINHESQHFSLFRFVVCFVVEPFPELQHALSRYFRSELLRRRGRCEGIGGAVYQQQWYRESGGVSKRPIAGLRVFGQRGPGRDAVVDQRIVRVGANHLRITCQTRRGSSPLDMCIGR